jgi:hypothetical protein
MSTRAYPFIAILLGPLCAVAAHGDVPRFGPHDVLSVFLISKSENKNQVHYGIRLDEHCAPRGGAPVAAYWRMLERGAKETDELLGHEAPAYGIAQQRVTARGDSGGAVRLSLRALPGRAIDVTTWKGGDGKCAATATTAIAGTVAQLQRVHAQIKWPFGVDKLVVSGVASADGSAISETIAR